MAVRIDAPVGLRNRVANVTNLAADQDAIIGLLATIPVDQGGQRENWVVRPLSGPDGSCPQFLADAIWDFQTLWNNVGLLLVVDGVVDPDRTTLAQLNDLASANPVGTLVDVIIKFQGTLDLAVPLAPSSVFPDALLGFYNTKPNRRLKRIGQTTTTVREQSAQLIAEHVARIKTLTVTGRGEIFLYGSSSGGRNAVDLAVALTREGIPVRWVASLDGAWFPDESLTQPDNFAGEPTVLPLFRPSGPVVAGTAESYFQRLGNHSELTFHGLLFTSQMGGKEVHGALEGFTSQDLTAAVSALLPVGDDDAHIKLTKVATPLLQASMAEVLNSL